MSKLKPQSNLPQEFIYVYGEQGNNEDEIIRRDEDIPNRYWFNVPSTWRTSTQKEYILGFRDVHVFAQPRHLQFQIEFQKYDSQDTSDIITGKFEVNSWWREYNNFEKLWTDFEEVAREYIYEHQNEWTGDNKLKMSHVHRDFQLEPYIKKGAGVNSFCERFLGNTDTVGDKIYTVQFKLSKFNDDAKSVLNLSDADITKLQSTWQESWTFQDVWFRDFPIMKSSVVSNANNNFLALHESDFSPIRYYRITSGDTKFYIELWNRQYINTPLYLPNDKKDYIVVELTLLDNSDFLYT